MSVKQIDPLQTNDLLQKDKTAAYVDVRTVQEFQAGHVPGAANIPVMIPDPSSGRMTPNPNFVQAIEAAFPKDRKLILGCQAGGRSQYAADLLDRSGYNGRFEHAGRLWRSEGSDGPRGDTGMAAVQSAGGDIGPRRIGELENPTGRLSKFPIPGLLL